MKTLTSYKDYVIKLNGDQALSGSHPLLQYRKQQQDLGHECDEIMTFLGTPSL